MRQRLAILLLASTAVLSLAAAQASASGSWHGISGTVYSDGTWFTSQNPRTVRATDGAIKVQFNTIPTGNLAWYVKNLNTNAKIGSTVYIPSVKAQLLGHARPGTMFVNVFKAQHTRCWRCSGWEYNFDGSERY